MIAGGGYSLGLIDATERYIRAPLRCRSDAKPRSLGLRDFVAESLADGSLRYFEPYEAVHRSNVEKVLG